MSHKLNAHTYLLDQHLQAKIVKVRGSILQAHTGYINMNDRHIGEQTVKLADIDLNLLVAFDALISERSVSEAALRLGLTQPAMSKRLAKLRKILRDDILIRTADGMQPTERAMDLAEPIQVALRQMEAALGSHLAFQPTRTTRVFRIATTDLIAAVLIPVLIQRLQMAAPALSLIIRVLHRTEIAEALDVGKIDLAITVLPDAPPSINRVSLFEERYVCLLAQNHPEIHSNLSLEQYVANPHVLITYTGDLKGVIDRMLDAQGLKRRVVASFPYHLAAPHVVANTNCIVTLSERIARLQNWVGVKVLPLPLDFSPYMETLLWHRRDDNDRTHQWLRSTICEIASEINN
ncbi:MAG: LysR family transcriptional regulator [Cyanobacteria bacterium P01_H01_bin.21]